MDDAVIAYQAEQLNVDYGFIRNVSDPVIRAKDSHEKPIPSEVQGDWSGMIYKYSGFYTSYNSALGTWASLNQFD